MLPLGIIVGFFLAFSLIGLIPATQSLATDGMTLLVYVLQTFGNGNVLQGSITIALAGGGVSTLFDMCNLLILSKPIR